MINQPIDITKTDTNTYSLLVARLPNGSWSYGGKPSDYKEYGDECELYRVWHRESTLQVGERWYIRKAQNWRSRQQKRG